MKKAKLFFSALFLLLGVTLSAQNVNISGTVKDASTGEGIPFAAIQVKGTSTGSATDANGAFSFYAPSNATLIFSSIGYLSEEVAVGGRTTLNVALRPDAESLENAVVIGYGSAKKVGNLVGSVSTVRSDIVKNAPAASALDNLQGQVAGLSVMTTGGVAGDNSVSMKIHGVGSLGSSSAPLYVIDGIPSSSRTIMAMNPNDILSISVLKDASATSIYGSRAANGVVFVTTKSGSYSTKSRVSIRSQYGISTLANTRLWESMMSGDELRDFMLRTGIYTPAQIRANYIEPGHTHNTKWYKIMQQLDTPQYQNDVTIEGGGQKVAYMVSASQFHQTGTTIGNFYNRYTVRSNVQAHPKDWLKIGINLNLSLDQRQQNSNWGDSSTFDANYTSGGLSFLLNPMYTPYDKDGNLLVPRFTNNTINPYHLMEARPRLRDSYGLNGGAYIEIEPIKNLKIRSQIGSDSRFYLNTSINYPSYTINSNSGAKLKSSQLTSNNTITNTIEYSFNIAEEHAISVLAGHEGISNYYDYFYAQTTGQKEDRLLRLNDGTTSSRDLGEEMSQSKFLSFFGHADYSYAGKYNLDLTVRNDASSRFGPNVRNATFWSAGFKWNARNERFVRNTPWLNDLSAKVSYGTQGNAAIGDYRHLGLIGTTESYNGDANAWVLAQPSNPDLTWEKQALLTVGFNTRIFNFLDFELEWYHRSTTSMLYSVPFPYTSGYSELTSNIGNLTNSGVDITLGIDILKNKDYYLRLSNVFNYNKQAIGKLFDAAWDEDLGRYRWIMTSSNIGYVEGQPISFYSAIYAGVDPADGAPMWYLPGEDPDVTTMNPDKVTKKYDEDALMQNTGFKLEAPINGGFSLEGGWKILSFRADFSYVLGKKLLNNDAYFYLNPNVFVAQGVNNIRDVADYWTPQNPNAKYPDWTQGYTMQFDTHLIEDASFMRLKSLQVGVSLPNKWLEAQKLFDSVRLTFTGRNLLTFTNYGGVDPEIDENLTMGIPGTTKQYLVGLELNF